MRRKLAFFRHRVTRELGVMESLGDYEQEELKSISQVAQLSTKDMYNLLTKASKPQPSSNKLSQALGIEYTTPEEK